MTGPWLALVGAVLGVVVMAVLGIAYRVGYAAAIKRHRRQLDDGEQYRRAIDEALRQCKASQHVEVLVQTRIAPRAARTGTGSLGLHVVPDYGDE